MRIRNVIVRAALALLLLAPAAAAAAAGPAPAKPLLTIPFELDGSLIIVAAGVNGSKPYRFVVDSGASRCAVDSLLVTDLRLHSHGRALLSGAGGSEFGNALDGVTFNLRGLDLTVSSQVFAVDVHGFKLPECYTLTPIDGLLGRGFVNAFVVRIDYQARRIALFDPKTFVYAGPGRAVPRKVTDHALVAPVRFTLEGGATVEGRFVVDTGAGAALTLANGFTRKNHVVTKERPGYDPEVPSVGIGGKVPERLVRAERVEIGGIEMRSVILHAMSNRVDLEAEGLDCLVGGPLLRRTRVYFDVRGKRLIVEPGASFGEPFTYWASGIVYVDDGKPRRSVTVLWLLPGSPATVAGLRKGDRILAVNKVPVADLTDERLDDMLDRDGSEVTLEYERAGARATLTYMPKQLV